MPTSTPQNKLIERLLKKRVRVCKSLHECCLCQQPIRYGEGYFDGGYGCRAHARCADPKNWGGK